jgi:phospholipid transport system substrate-binding protein
MVLWTGKPARAQSGATALVRSVLDKAMDIQTNSATQGPEHRKERAELIRKLISENFLTEEMARESLKDHWGKLSAGQRQQYLPLFTAIFVDSYTRRVLDFLKRENIEYPGEIAEGKDIKVQTVLMRPNEHIPVDYIVRQTGHKWMIRDVIIDGVSTVETYQNAFDRFLGTKPFSDLIHSMSIQIKAGAGV